MYKKKKVQTVFHCIVVCFYLCVKYDFFCCSAIDSAALDGTQKGVQH